MDASSPRRARSLEEMDELDARMGELDMAAAIADYRPRPGDVIISPYAKCGTTWLQQTFHTLRTGGDMDFDDISRVVPWIETSRLLEIDLEAPQRADPRGFKSHLAWDEIPKGARYVVSQREPKDALVSMHRFMEGWMLEPGAVGVGVLGHLGSGPTKLTPERPQQQRHQPQQRRLAAAVRPHQQHGVAGIQRELQPGEHQAVAAQTGEI